MLEYIYLGLIINFMCIIVVALLSVFQVFTSTPKKLLRRLMEHFFITLYHIMAYFI